MAKTHRNMALTLKDSGIVVASEFDAEGSDHVVIEHGNPSGKFSLTIDQAIAFRDALSEIIEDMS